MLTGPKGDKGDPGEKGRRGLIGFIGYKGEQGNVVLEISSAKCFSRLEFYDLVYSMPSETRNLVFSLSYSPSFTSFMTYFCRLSLNTVSGVG